MIKKKLIKINKEITYKIFLIFFAIVFNQYYGYQGILPIDSFLVFNSGFDLMNGYLPFKDYWTIKEPFIDFLQAIFFKIFGVSWFSYVLHASIFNAIITISTFFILKKFNLKLNFCFFYSFCVAVLTYPTAGTPFSDHHTLILSLISLFFFILAVKTGKNIYWFLTPVILGFSFLSKQAPTAYIVIIISLLSIFYFFYKKDLVKFYYALGGLLFILSLFFVLIFLGKINFNDFLVQYIYFPQSLGGTRLDWVFPLEFKRFVWRFKLLYLSIGVLIYLLIKNALSKNKIKIEVSDYIILTSITLSCIFFIFHQLMTINAIFIYCLIPIFAGFSHAYANSFIKINFIKNFLLILTICSTVYYFFSYVNSRAFMDLKNVNFNNSIDGKLIDEKFSKIKWITMFYPDNPTKETQNIKFALKTIKNEKDIKMVITDYQFISVFLNEYDYTPTRFWYEFHGYPDEKNNYFYYWKNFVLENIKKNNINSIYVFGPLLGEKKPLENILKGCFTKVEYSEIFYKLNLKNC